MKGPITVMAVALTALLAPTAVAQAQTQDSVTGSGTTSDGFAFDIDARSGPGGENPTGEVSFRFTSGTTFFAGTVICLSVEGSFATIHVQTSQFGVVGLEVTDSPAGDLIRGIPVDPAIPCAPIGGAVDFPVSSGDVAVTDAQELPVSTDQCRNGGWKTYGVFKNRGDCVSFVATKGKNTPG